MRLPPFTCPVCNYQSTLKTDMRRHFKRQTPCPKLENDIELTDEIKEYVLANRIYRIPAPPPPPPPPATTIINNYNQVVNIVNQMKPHDKLSCLTNHTNVELLDFDFHVSKKLHPQTMLYLQDKSPDTEPEYLKNQAIVEIIRDVCNSTAGDCSDFCIIFDAVKQNIRIRDRYTWQEMLLDKGIKHIMSVVQQIHLDAYETCLINKCQVVPLCEKETILNKIDEYYAFIGTFNLEPAVAESNRKGARVSPPLKLYEEFQKRFKAVTEKLTKPRMDAAVRDVCKILQASTKRNIEELNTKVMDMLRIDQTFRNAIMEGFQVHTM